MSDSNAKAVGLLTADSRRRDLSDRAAFGILRANLGALEREIDMRAMLQDRSPHGKDLQFLAQDPEKTLPGLDPGWEPVFGKDHAQTRC